MARLQTLLYRVKVVKLRFASLLKYSFKVTNSLLIKADAVQYSFFINKCLNVILIVNL